MSGPILYVTGTNTGVGKTTLATLLLRRARERNIPVAALKPFCAGDRDDAERLHALQNSGLSLDEVNPFFFSEPLAPLVAARRAGKTIRLPEVLSAIKSAGEKKLPLLIEGAGGLLSPLGELFSLHEIISEFPGKVCVVAPNALGSLNSILLTLHRVDLLRTCVVLMNPQTSDLASETNPGALKTLVPGLVIHELPFLSGEAPSTLVDPILGWWIR
jgi:dethiobiotin synthetase